MAIEHCVRIWQVVTWQRLCRCFLLHFHNSVVLENGTCLCGYRSSEDFEWDVWSEDAAHEIDEGVDRANTGPVLSRSFYLAIGECFLHGQGLWGSRGDGEEAEEGGKCL
ncbi:hypothetical protein V6N13_080603 [Hibiscus sabdariffa]